MQKVIERLIHSTPALSKNSYTVAKLAGQASTREYFRITFDNGQTAVLMKIPAGAASVSEEISKSDQAITELPFINVQKYLESLALPVPHILAYSQSDSLLLLQDLGDESLEQVIRGASKEALTSSYQQAISLLVEMQTKTTTQLDARCVAFSRMYDENLLNGEFDHFVEYGIEDRFQKKMNQADRKKFDEMARSITQQLTQTPQGFVHRDFQSRNLIRHDNKLWMIDFQDALMGPMIYDLAALLRDSYVSLDWSTIDKLQKDYLEKIGKNHPYKNREKELKKDFDLQTIQRKLKDAGRFQYILTVKKNPSFLVHVPHSLRYVREALERRKEYAEMLSLLEKYILEFNL